MDLNGLLDDRREGRCKRIVGLEREDARFSPGGYGRADPEPACRAKKRTVNGHSLPGSGSIIGLPLRNIRTR